MQLTSACPVLPSPSAVWLLQLGGLPGACPSCAQRPPAPAPHHCGRASWTSSPSCCLLPSAAAPVASKQDERPLQICLPLFTDVSFAFAIRQTSYANVNASRQASSMAYDSMNIAKQDSTLHCIFGSSDEGAGCKHDEYICSSKQEYTSCPPASYTKRVMHLSVGGSSRVVLVSPGKVLDSGVVEPDRVEGRRLRPCQAGPACTTTSSRNTASSPQKVAQCPKRVDVRLFVDNLAS